MSKVLKAVTFFCATVLALQYLSDAAFMLPVHGSQGFTLIPPLDSELNYYQLYGEDDECDEDDSELPGTDSEIYPLPAQPELNLPGISGFQRITPLPSSVKTAQWLAGEISSLENTLKHSHISFQKYAHERIQKLMNQYMQSYMKEQLVETANQYGTLNLDIVINKNWRIEGDFKIDYMTRVAEMDYNGEHSLFTQVGYRKFYDRRYVNLGLGFRSLMPDFLLYGGNFFYDEDLLASHRRISLGVEMARDSWRFSSNYYFPVSGNRPQPIEAPGFRFNARPAKGYDMNLTGWLSSDRAISANVRYYRWQGHLVDPFSSYHKYASRQKPFGNLSRHPKGGSFDLNWQLFPAIGTTIKYMKTLDYKTDISGHLDLTLDFDKSVFGQFSPTAVKSTRMLSGMKDSMVRRQSEIVLKYQEFDSVMPVRLSITIRLVELNQTVLVPTVELSFPPVSYSWSGSITPFLNSTTIEKPTVDVPRHATSQKKYTAQLTVVDFYGKAHVSNIAVVEIVPNKNLKLELMLFDDSALKKPVTLYRQSMGDPGKTIYWKLVWGKRIDINAQSTGWSASPVLQSSGVNNPVIETLNPAGTYQAILDVSDPVEGQHQLSAGIEITRSAGYPIIWTSSKIVGGIVTEEFSPGKPVSNITAAPDPSSQLPPPANAIYYINASGGTRVNSIDKNTGDLILNSAGTETVKAILAADSNHQQSESSYLLKVTRGSQVDLSWDANVIKAGTYELDYKSVPDYTARAASAVGGTIIYHVDPAGSNVAEMIPDTSNMTGTVKPVGAGTTNIFATRQTDSNYLEKTISYVLTVRKATSTGLYWEQGKLSPQNELILTYQPNITARVKAIGPTIATPITYRSRDRNIAEADPANDGTINIIGAGNCDIEAAQAGDKDHLQTTIAYQLKVLQGINSKFGWQPGHLSNKNTVTKVIKVGSQTILIPALPGDSTGSITYSVVNPPPPAPVVLNMVNASTGELDIQNTGTATVYADQAADSNFVKGQISYTATVEKSDPLLAWDPAKVTGNILIRKLDKNVQETVKTTSTRGSTGTISYVVDSGGVVVDSATGEVTTSTAGPFKVTASIQESLNYKASSDYYEGVVLDDQTGLHWDPKVSSPYEADTLSTFTLNAIKGKNSNPITYVIANDTTASSLNPPGSSTISTNMTGTLDVEATQQSDGVYSDKTISYTLTVNRKPDTAFNWKDADAKSGAVTVIYDPQNSMFRREAVTTVSTGAITYTHQNGPGDAINRIEVDGTVRLDHAGIANVYGLLAEDSHYQGAIISYMLTVNKFTPVLTWDSAAVDAGNVLKFKLIEQGTVTATATSTGSPPDYRVKSGVSVVNVNNSGLVTAVSHGSFEIEAYIPVSSDSTGAVISYTGIALKKDSGLSWDDPTGKIVSGIYSVGTKTTYTINSRKGTNTTSPVTYTVQDISGTSVASLQSPNLGAVNTNLPGTARVSATQLSDGVHADNTINYDAVVAKRNTTLRWDPNAPLGPPPDYNYSVKLAQGTISNIRAIDDEVSSGAEMVEYELSSGSGVTINSSTGVVTLNSVGVHVIKAKQLANNYFNLTQISYKLAVKDSVKFSSTVCEFRADPSSNIWNSCPVDNSSGRPVPVVFEARDFILTVTSNNTDPTKKIVFSTSSALIQLNNDGSGSGNTAGSAQYTISQAASSLIEAGQEVRSLMVSPYAKPVVGVKLKGGSPDCKAYITANAAAGALKEDIKGTFELKDPANLLQPGSVNIFVATSTGSPMIDGSTGSNIGGVPDSEADGSPFTVNAVSKGYYFNPNVILWFNYRLITGEEFGQNITGSPQFRCPAVP